MRLIIDTNVFVSGVFFGGVPGQILDLWKEGLVDVLMSEEILAEYVDVFRRLAKRYPGIDPDPIVGLLVKKAVFVQPARLPEQVCADPDDDKFVAAALGGQAGIVVSGDRHLLDISGRRGLVVMKPSAFLDHFGSRP